MKIEIIKRIPYNWTKEVIENVEYAVKHVNHGRVTITYQLKNDCVERTITCNIKIVTISFLDDNGEELK